MGRRAGPGTPTVAPVQLLPAERIELRGLILQRETVADAERVATAVADNLSHLTPWMAWAVPEASAVSFQRERLTSAMKRWQDGTDYGYLLWARDSDELLGMCGLHRRIGPGGIELGYWLTVAAVGHGHITSAAQALTIAGLALPGVDRVEIHCDEANVRSQAVPRRLGYRLDRIEADDIAAPAETGWSMIWIFR